MIRETGRGFVKFSSLTYITWVRLKKIIRIALMLILVAGLYFVKIKENIKLFRKKFVFYGLLKLKSLVHPFYKLVFSIAESCRKKC